MPSKKLFLLIILSIVTVPSIAETIHDWNSILHKSKCELDDGAFFLWDSKQCLFHYDSLILDGKRIQLKKEGYAAIKTQRKGFTSEGDKFLRTYSGDGLILKLTLTYLPGCYGDEKCTFSEYFADFEVVYTDKAKKPLKYQGVGYEGS